MQDAGSVRSCTICSTLPEGQQPRLSIIQDLTWGKKSATRSLKKIEAMADGT